MTNKKAKIGNKEVELKTSAYTPILYADLFKGNLFGEMQEIVNAASKTGTIPFEKITILYKLAYCMAKQADDSIGTMREWLDQFEPLDILDIVGDLIDLWTADGQQQSTP